jgi:ketosteroid isomerase-like protein
MKRLMIVTALLLFAGISFGQSKASAQVDVEAEKAAINKLMDKFDAEFQNGDASLFLSSLAEDALICGTDPSEFWNKKQYLEFNDQQSNTTVPEFKYMDDRVTKVAPDGNSAIIVTQFIIEWSPKIPWRNTYHFIKTNDGWKVYFVNFAFIPKNEHIGIINEAIE